jgi:hypothetical protein
VNERIYHFIGVLRYAQDDISGLIVEIAELRKCGIEKQKLKDKGKDEKP